MRAAVDEIGLHMIGSVSERKGEKIHNLLSPSQCTIIPRLPCGGVYLFPFLSFQPANTANDNDKLNGEECVSLLSPGQAALCGAPRDRFSFAC